MKKILTAMLCVSLILSAFAVIPVVASGSMQTTPTTTTTHTYSDIPSSWAGEVYNAIAAGYIPVSLQSEYQQNITRAELCQLIAYYYLDTHAGFPGLPIATMDKQVSESGTYASLGLTMPSGNVFTDTSSYYVRLAYTANIVSGYNDGTFKPNGNITREEAAVMLTNSTKGVTVNANQEAISFSDSESFSAWAKDSIAYITGVKTYNTDVAVMTGGSNNKFNSHTNLTREEAIIIVHRLRNATIPKGI